MRWAVPMRLPMMMGALESEERKCGMSAGECWPSPSMVRTEEKPFWAAKLNPVRRAAPLPCGEV